MEPDLQHYLEQLPEQTRVVVTLLMKQNQSDKKEVSGLHRDIISKLDTYQARAEARMDRYETRMTAHEKSMEERMSLFDSRMTWAERLIWISLGGVAVMGLDGVSTFVGKLFT